MQAAPFQPELLFQVLHHYKTALQHAFKSQQLPLSILDAKILKLIAYQEINTPQMLAQYSGRDKAQVTRLISDMELRGLIEKVPHPTDKRSVCLVLSEQALTLVEQLRHIDRDISSQMLAGISENEQHMLSLVLHKITANLQ